MQCLMYGMPHQHPDVDPELLTISQAAALMGVHTDTLRRWDRAGSFPAVTRTSTRHRRYRRSDVEAQMRSRGAVMHIYRIFDGDTNDLLYVGASHDPMQKIQSHRRQDWWPANARID